MSHSQRIAACVLAFATLAAPGLVLGQSVPTDTGTLDKDSAMAFAKRPYSPYAGRDFPTRPFFGDTHLHTSFSMDAGAFGCRLSPADAVARFPRRRGSLRQHGILSGPPRWKA
jgi:hypothetical protein